jgi:hypothetical protein
MVSDGVVPSTETAFNLLDHKPVKEKDLVFPDGAKPTDKVEDSATPGAAQPAEGSTVPLKDHPEYGKFFRMLKAGIPSPAVKAKMTAEGFDSDLLDRSPTDLVPLDLPKKTEAAAEGEGEMVPCKDHPVYSKYFKMLKVGLPIANVRAKMEQEGHDSSILDKSPTDLVPLEIKAAAAPAPPVEMVALQDHPAYGKYLRMLKVGLPLVAAKQKMVDDGFDPTILDKGPGDMVPVDTSYRAPEVKAPLKKPAKAAVKVRKKKLHWKALDKSRVGADSVWAVDDDDDGFQLDPDEFDQLFVEREQKGAAKPLINEQKKKTVVNLVDPKRAQNAGIALARLKLPFVEVRQR